MVQDPLLILASIFPPTFSTIPMAYKTLIASYSLLLMFLSLRLSTLTFRMIFLANSSFERVQLNFTLLMMASTSLEIDFKFLLSLTSPQSSSIMRLKLLLFFLGAFFVFFLIFLAFPALEFYQGICLLNFWLPLLQSSLQLYSEQSSLIQGLASLSLSLLKSVQGMKLRFLAFLLESSGNVNLLKLSSSSSLTQKTRSMSILSGEGQRTSGDSPLGDPSIYSSQLFDLIADAFNNQNKQSKLLKHFNYQIPTFPNKIIFASNHQCTNQISQHSDTNQPLTTFWVSSSSLLGMRYRILPSKYSLMAVYFFDIQCCWIPSFWMKAKMSISRGSETSKPSHESMRIILYKIDMFFIVVSERASPFLIAVFFYEAALSVSFEFRLSPLSQMFPLFPIMIPTSEFSESGASIVRKWCFCFLISLWETCMNTPASSLPYLGLRVCRLKDLSMFVDWTSATTQSPSCMILRMLNSSSWFFFRCSEMQAALRFKQAAAEALMSIFHLLFDIQRTLPTTMSPTWGVYLFLRGLTMMSLLVISTVPIKEAYIPFSARQVPCPLCQQSRVLHEPLLRGDQVARNHQIDGLLVNHIVTDVDL